MISVLQTDCFLLCFSVNNRSSFENTVSKWYPEVHRYCPRATILLIGKIGEIFYKTLYNIIR